MEELQKSCTLGKKTRSYTSLGTVQVQMPVGGVVNVYPSLYKVETPMTDNLSISA